TFFIHVEDNDNFIRFAEDNAVEFQEGQGAIEIFLEATATGVTASSTVVRLLDGEGNPLPPDRNGRYSGSSGVQFPKLAHGPSYLDEIRVVFDPETKVTSALRESWWNAGYIENRNRGRPYTLYIGEDDDNFTDDVLIYEIRNVRLRPDRWGGLLENPLRWKFTVKDNDEGGWIEFAGAESFVSEGGAGNSTDLDIYLRQPIEAEDTKVDLTFGGDTVMGMDYTVTSTPGNAYDSATDILTFPANTEKVTLTITSAADDSVFLGSKEIILELSERIGTGDELPENWNIRSGGNRHTVTIVDDDGRLAFAASESTLAEEPASGEATSPSVPINLTLSPIASELKLDVNISGTATATDDYTLALTSPSGATYAGEILTIPANTSEVIFTLQSVDDALADSAETVTLTLAERSGGDAFPEGFQFSGAVSHTVTITDAESRVGILEARKNATLNEPSTGQNSSIPGGVSFGAIGAGGGPNTDPQADAAAAAVLASAMTEDITLEVSQALVTGDTAIPGDQRNLPANPDGSEDYVGTLVIDKDTGLGSLNITVREDEFPEGQEWFFLRILDPNGDLPAGWTIDTAHDEFRVVIFGNDNAVRFAEWPRNGTKSVSALEAVVAEGHSTRMTLLASHIPPGFGLGDDNSGINVLIDVPEQYREDINISNAEYSRSSYDGNGNFFFRRSIRNPVFSPRPHETGMYFEGINAANIAASLVIEVLNDVDTGGPEGEEVIPITVMNVESPSAAERAWGTVANVPDGGDRNGNGVVPTSTTFMLTIPDKLDNIFFKSDGSRVVSGGMVDVEVLIVPRLSAASSVLLTSTSSTVTVTGSQYDSATNVLTLPAGVDKVTLSVEATGSGIQTLRLAPRSSSPLPSSHRIGTRNTHDVILGQTIGFAENAPEEAREGGRTIDIPIESSAALPENVNLTVSVSGTAEPGDYTIQGTGHASGAGTLMLPRNATGGRLTFTANPDLDADPETVRIELTGTLPSGYDFRNRVHTVNITEPPTVQFVNGGQQRIYEGESISATLELSRVLEPNLMIPLIVQLGSRHDYYSIGATGSGGVNINRITNIDVRNQRKARIDFGQRLTNGSATLTITAREENEDTLDESITISIDSDNLPLNYVAGEADTWTISIIDNDKTIQFGESNIDIREPGRGDTLGNSHENGFMDGCASVPQECVVRYFDVVFDGIPTEPFNVRFRKYSDQESRNAFDSLIRATDWGYPTFQRITPADATTRYRGGYIIQVPILVRHNNDSAPDRHWGMKILPDGLPRGWSLGETRDMIVTIPCNDNLSCRDGNANSR
ncbi:MAG: hypothetical protein OXF29_02455, partial [Hyphomicrobiales bacterium]|nr:hypothetical protein [Hyphomicrobiales bacterium]